MTRAPAGFWRLLRERSLPWENERCEMSKKPKTRAACPEGVRAAVRAGSAED
jgi:hypothetical protein